MKVKNRPMTFYGAIMYYCGAINLKDESNARVRLLHPLTWVFLFTVVPCIMLWAGVSNWPEVFGDIKDQSCLW